MDVDDLATLAANTVVAATVTDIYDGIRDRVARLFGRGDPDPAAARRLDVTRAELAKATGTGAEQALADHQAQWKVRFADLLDVHPDAAAQLKQLAADIQAQLPAQANVANTIIGGVHHGPVLMGRDFTGIIVHPDHASDDS